MKKHTLKGGGQIPARSGSVWEQSAPHRSSRSQLESTRNVDIAVIGAGFTGLSCAIAAAAAGQSVAVLETHSPGFGGSGRNAGQWLVGWSGRTPESVQRQFGAEIGGFLNRYNLNAVHSLQNSSAAKVSDLRKTGVLTLARDRKHLAALANMRRQWREIGAEMEILGKDELAAHLKSDRYCGALYCRDGGTIDPLAYALALADEAEANGVEIFANTPATAIRSSGAGWTIETPKYEVCARQVAICTNAYGGAIWSGLDRSFYRIRMAMIASDPLHGQTLEFLPTRTPFADVGAIAIFGGMIDVRNRFIASVFPRLDRNSSPGELASGFDEQFRKTFPDATPPKWIQNWYGDLCVTPDRLPKLFDLAPGVAAAIGYSGAGIAFSGALGRTLSEHLQRPGSTGFPVSSLRPAPFSKAVPFVLNSVAAPISRMIQQI